jgi:GNAT superfamily N-acetyltransferase
MTRTRDTPEQDRLRGEYGRYYVSTDRSKLDTDMVLDFLSRSYWARDTPTGALRVSLETSFCLGLYEAGGGQVGFARVVTDFARIAFLSDVFILEGHRCKGLGKLLIREVLNHPLLRDIETWMLATRDAHALYEQFGFRRYTGRGRLMVLRPSESRPAVVELGMERTG